MDWNLVVLLSIQVTFCLTKEVYEPAVAFVCKHGAMHMEEGKGWVSDKTTDCMESKADILNYCKKMYPNYEVTNIVETSTYKHIRGWCPLNETCHSDESFKVRPYRCLTGPFQSDALIVPKKCEFDHVRVDSACKEFDYWKVMAVKLCKDKQMSLNNFAMLLPCGTDVFTGVEYVCCPDEQVSATTLDTTSSTTQIIDRPSISVEVKSFHKNEDTKPAVDPDLSIVSKYLHMTSEAFRLKEHDVFQLAKKSLNKFNHSKMSTLMKEWASARKMIEDTKTSNPKEASRLTKELLPRLQKEYFALETDAENRLIKLDSVHQQHVQTNLNAKKRMAAEHLLEALQESKPHKASILKYIQRYISVEEKDAQHTLQHFLKIRSRDPQTALSLLPTTIEHLSLISSRVNQTIGLLNTLDMESLKQEIENEVKLWLSKRFKSIDKVVQQLKALLSAPTTTTSSTLDVKTVESATAVVEKAPHVDISVNVLSTEDPHMYKKYAEKLAKTDFVKVKGSEPFHVHVEYTSKNEKNAKQVVPSAQVNHMAKEQPLAVQSNNAFSDGGLRAAHGLSAGAGVAIAIGALAFVFITIGVGYILTKKIKTEAYLEVSVQDPITVEDKHIARMQTGYENPTYKLIERTEA